MIKFANKSGQAKYGMMLEEFPKSTVLSKNEVPLMGNTIFATLPPLLFLKDVHIHPFNRPHDEDDVEECFPAGSRRQNLPSCPLAVLAR